MSEDSGQSTSPESSESNQTGLGNTFSIDEPGGLPKEPPAVAEEPMPGTQDASQMEAPRTYAGKYNSVDELEKAHISLQSKMGGQMEERAGLGVDGMLDHVGLTGQEVIDNFREHGHLTDDQYKAFASKMGLSKELVDTFITGQIAIAQTGNYEQEKMAERAYQMAGGKEQWENLARWAQSNYDETKLERLNEQLADPARYEDAVGSMLWSYKEATGSGNAPQQLLAGDNMPNTSSGFESVEEFLSEMNRVNRQGYPDKAFQKRVANTPKHIIQGVNR
tara:strand:+ start:454 stop:1287 length:834 start_codon:yes stop_codon:yes gene_type:complete